MIHQCVIRVSSFCQPAVDPPQQMQAIAEDSAAFHFKSVHSKDRVSMRMKSDAFIPCPSFTVNLLSLFLS